VRQRHTDHHRLITLGARCSTILATTVPIVAILEAILESLKHVPSWCSATPASQILTHHLPHHGLEPPSVAGASLYFPAALIINTKLALSVTGAKEFAGPVAAKRWADPE